jgi:hypothetical protein
MIHFFEIASKRWKEGREFMTSPKTNGTDGKKWRILQTVLLVVVVFLTMVWMRAFYGSMEAYKEGKRYFEQDQLVSAITFFDRSIHWYTPYNPYVEKSAKKLWEIGERGQRAGDIKLALIAFRAIRGGFYSARSFYTPGKEWIRMSEHKIQELEGIEMAQRGLQGDAKIGGSVWEGNQEVPGPNPGWSVVVVLSFLGWVGSLLAFIPCAFGAKGEGKGRLSRAGPWLGVAAVFYILWIIAMFRA